jgi:flagellar biosynthetic protein FlhB
VLGSFGEGLIEALVTIVRDAVAAPSLVVVDAATVVGRVRDLAFALLLPLGMIVGGFAIGATAAHQMQVRGLWTPSVIAPDVSRLWMVGRGEGLFAGFEKTAWSVTKAVVLGGVLYWAFLAEWRELRQLSGLEFPTLARAAAETLIQPLRVLAGVMLVLGLADYGLRYLRFEAMLRTTPEEQREDQKVMEGDPSLRSKRRRLARAWRGDAPELLAGGSLIVEGSEGLTIVLTGGPPPKRIKIRTAGQGNTGLQLRRNAAKLRLPQIAAPELAVRLARHASADPDGKTPVPHEISLDLAAIWRESPASRESDV